LGQVCSPPLGVDIEFSRGILLSDVLIPNALPGGGPLQKFKNILVPVDFSGTTEPSIGYGLQLSEKFNAKLHLLHAVHEAGEDSGLSSPHVSVEKSLEESKERLERELLRYAVSQLGTSADYVTEVRIGPPHTVIIEYAEEKDVDLIVIGERRMGKIAHALYQKTANQVLEGSDRPVLRLIITG
jgi:nucleotide-binding universal stress UspA family protein